MTSERSKIYLLSIVIALVFFGVMNYYSIVRMSSGFCLIAYCRLAFRSRSGKRVALLRSDAFFGAGSLLISI